ARVLMDAGAFPPVRREQALGLRSPGPPFPISAAAALGVPPNSAWFMTVGQGDPLARIALHLFPPGANEPSWVLKIARVAGYREPFDRDEEGLKLARETASATARAPALLGRFEVSGLHASL